LVFGIKETQNDNNKDLFKKDLEISDLLINLKEYDKAVTKLYEAIGTTSEGSEYNQNDIYWAVARAKAKLRLGEVYQLQNLDPLGNSQFSQGLAALTSIKGNPKYLPNHKEWYSLYNQLINKWDCTKILRGGSQTEWEKEVQALQAGATSLRVAVAYLRDLVKKYPEDNDLRIKLANLHFNTGVCFRNLSYPDDARSHFQAATAELKAMLAMLAKEAERLENKPAERQDSELSAVYGRIAGFWLLAGESPNLAIENAVRGIELDSSQPWIKANLVLAYLDNNQPDRAKELLFANISTGPKSLEFIQIVVQNLGTLVQWRSYQGDYGGTLRLADSISSILEDVNATHPEYSGKLKVVLAAVYVNIAGLKLMLQAPPAEVIQAAMRGIEVDPNQLSIKINLAHGYLFDNQFEKAKSLYLSNQDQSLANGHTFKQTVLDDFVELRQHGITHPDMAKIEKLLSKNSFENEPDGHIAQVNYGIDGKPAFNSLVGYAIKRMDPRQRGDTIDSYHGPGGELITGPEGYAERRRHWTEDGELLSEAFFGPNGAPVIGPGGYHRSERVPGDSNAFRYFDTQNRELPSLGPDSVVSVIFVAELTGTELPAAKAGVQAGDILWRYGSWSFLEALTAERAKGTKPDALINAVAQTFFAERDRLSGGSAVMTVIRKGKPVKIKVPPLPDKSLGARLVDRTVPIATFESWKANVAGK
jgi:hypothetical protein